MAKRAEREMREIRLTEMAEVSPELRRLSDLWIALERAMVAPAAGATLLDTWGTEPWDSKHPPVVAAWAAVSDPENREALRAWIAQPKLNARALQLARRALEACVRRSGA